MEDDQSQFGLKVQVTDQFGGEGFSQSTIEQIVRAVCEQFGLSEADISIVLVNDDQVRKLNKQFLDRDNVTDCLSFDLSDDADTSKTFEIIVNAELAVREAQQRGHSPQAELALYIVHGLLHQLGFDDKTESQAQEMHQKENEILQQMGYPAVYN